MTNAQNIKFAVYADDCMENALIIEVEKGRIISSSVTDNSNGEKFNFFTVCDTIEEAVQVRDTITI